jgi:hypothetical protein
MQLLGTMHTAVILKRNFGTPLQTQHRLEAANQ